MMLSEHGKHKAWHVVLAQRAGFCRALKTVRSTTSVTTAFAMYRVESIARKKKNDTNSSWLGKSMLLHANSILNPVKTGQNVFEMCFISSEDDSFSPNTCFDRSVLFQEGMYQSSESCRALLPRGCGSCLLKKGHRATNVKEFSIDQGLRTAKVSATASASLG